MNHPIDRDETQVRHAWPQASTEQPPATLDAAILAAARDSAPQPAASAPDAARRRSWRGLPGWQSFAAAAAIAGIAFVLLPSQPRHDSSSPTRMLETRTAAPVAATLPSEDAAATGSAEAATTRPPTLVDAGERASTPVPVARQERAPAQDAAAPAMAEPDPAAKSVSAAELDSSDADYASSRARPAASAVAAAARPPAAWLADIDARLAAGDGAGAAQALREFRAQVPDADTHLPPSLQEWARTVQ